VFPELLVAHFEIGVAPEEKRSAVKSSTSFSSPADCKIITEVRPIYKDNCVSPFTRGNATDRTIRKESGREDTEVGRKTAYLFIA
jgi:hypothetical protein